MGLQNIIQCESQMVSPASGCGEPMVCNGGHSNPLSVNDFTVSDFHLNFGSIIQTKVTQSDQHWYN